MTSKTLKSSAPGPYLGYSLQSTRMCLHLCLASPGSVVALEVLDDVDVELPGGKRLVEQSKSSLDGNPIANWSKDLWKTFSNWIDAIDAELIDVSVTVFRLFVLQKREGEFAEELSYCRSESQALEAIKKIRLAYTKGNKAKGCKEYIEKFLNYDREKLLRLVINFELETGDNQLVEGIANHFATTVPAISLSDTCVAAIGWVKTKTDDLIKDGKYPAISRADFVTWSSNYNTRFSYNHLLRYTQPVPSPQELEDGREEALVMLKQLDLIKSDESEYSEAMSDFLRAKVNKIRLAADGVVLEEQFSDFTNRLIGYWKRERLTLDMTMESSDDAVRGKLLYYNCTTERATINGVEAPDFLLKGTYHAQSNSKRIGWHPKYLELLGDD